MDTLKCSMCFPIIFNQVSSSSQLACTSVVHSCSTIYIFITKFPGVDRDGDRTMELLYTSDRIDGREGKEDILNKMMNTKIPESRGLL